MGDAEKEKDLLEANCNSCSHMEKGECRYDYAQYLKEGKMYCGLYEEI